MTKVTDESFKKAYKPFDIVSDKGGNVGLIKEVNVNSCQDTFEHQISYAITWLTGTNRQSAWFHHYELQRHCNLFLKIAECAASGHGGNYRHVEKLFKHM